MATNWTNAQMCAIEAKKKKILVSAAAGSGKTATLIERIIRSITEDNPPMDISRMLIVTFTRAAAAELRLRIMKALSGAIQDDPNNIYLRRQLLLLESADISTIDSFCLDVMRSQIKDGDSEYDFRLGDENELRVITTSSMDAAIETVIKQRKEADPKDRSVYEFFSVLSGTRNDEELIDNLLEIYKSLINVPEGIDYVAHYIDELTEDSENGRISTRAEEVILAHTERLFHHFDIVVSGFKETLKYNENVKKSYGNAIDSDIEYFRTVKNACTESDYARVRTLLTDYKMASLGSLKKDKKTPLSEKFTNARKKYKDDIKELKEKYFGSTDEDIRILNQKAIAFLKILYEILREYERLAEKAKRSKHIMEFNDLKLGVYKLFCTPDGQATQTAKEYSSKYDIIYIDEYQDVDPIQGRIFAALSVNSCLYTVGDIKQSIYGFRGSDPTIFGDLRQKYENYDKCDKLDPNGTATIYMSNNFRCSEPIIKASNHICSFLFKNTDACFGGVGYVDEDDLCFSKKKGDHPSKKVEIVFVDAPGATSDDISDEVVEEEDVSKFTNEVLFIKKKITAMMCGDCKEDGTPFSYGDFAILFDNNKQLKAVSELLSSLGLPCDDAPIENFFSSPEILLIHSFLSIIDNPLRDVEFTSVMLSPIFNLDDSELCEIRLLSKASTVYEAMRDYAENGLGLLRYKCRNILSRLEKYTHQARVLSLDEFIPYLWNSLDLNAIASFDGDNDRSAEMRRANIGKLYDYAMAYNTGMYRTLHDFLVYLNELIEVNTPTLTSDSDPASGDKVRLITIHKSKGLEFPVCFIFGTGFQNTGKPKIPDVLFESTVGVCFDPAARNGLVRLNSPYRKAALARRLEKQRLEKIRLLYVAMTRARERLYITCTKTKTVNRMLETLRETSPSLAPFVDTESAYVLLKSKNYIEWIMFSDPYRCSEFIKIVNYEPDIEDALPINDDEDNDTESTKSYPEFDKDEVRAHLLYDYSPPYPEIPAKLAVSSLSPSILDENPVYGITNADRRIGFNDIPTFASSIKATATERGTANHLFLQFCDFSACEGGTAAIECEIKRLVDEGFIISSHADMINVRNIERFFASDFYRSVKNAERIWREQRFNLPLPAHVFSEDSAKKHILRKHYLLVQGVIDIIIMEKNGSIVLADYKTDYIPEEIRRDDAAIKGMFSERYLQQLSYYALAIKQIFGRYPDSIIIYSLSMAKTYELDFDPSAFD